jgi:hypothetical protein
MKLGIVILAALAVMTCSRMAVAGDADHGLVIKAADKAVEEPVVRFKRLHRFVRPLPYYSEPPIACEAVVFPRSPLCAGRPAAYGPYATFPWNYYWSY